MKSPFRCEGGCSFSLLENLTTATGYVLRTDAGSTISAVFPTAASIADDPGVRIFSARTLAQFNLKRISHPMICSGSIH
ncbi:MAG: hypothetical protein QOF62_1004 [Pyrinomonadaceae bacterium]|jgi:hypothetical protein|nr:hypothetical protein [Pyrinomonadaceae bacterium]